ncbi:HPr kinase/phosphorylase [Phenylobacterium sp.]|uniref:HPr kinase/phosphorylase n=1 Tax=Phenylobacterium sp. TaxID=1871053 RepID=UPI00286C600C|nr:HPr kinase/phosphorylase [Phenylobacterium sp.]
MTVHEGVIAHAGLIAARASGPWRGVLIEGPPGAGKSDLALRALDAGFRLVADDRVALWTCDGRLFGAPPPALAGLIEARGLDILRVSALPLAEVVLVVRCGLPERLPPPRFREILGLALPMIELDPRDASALAKLARAVSYFDRAGNRRI